MSLTKVFPEVYSFTFFLKINKKKKRTEQKEKESKMLKKYNSKKEKFCTLDHTTRA